MSNNTISMFDFDRFPFHNFGFSDYDDVTNEVHRLFNRFIPEMRVGDFKNDSYSYETTSSYSRDANGHVRNTIQKKYTDPSGRDKFVEKKSIGDVRNPNQISMTTCRDTEGNVNTTTFHGVEDETMFNHMWNKEYENGFIKDVEYEEQKKQLENDEIELATLQKEINKKRKDVYERRLKLAQKD